MKSNVGRRLSAEHSSDENAGFEVHKTGAGLATRKHSRTWPPGIHGSGEGNPPFKKIVGGFWEIFRRRPSFLWNRRTLSLPLSK